MSHFERERRGVFEMRQMITGEAVAKGIIWLVVVLMKNVRMLQALHLASQGAPAVLTRASVRKVAQIHFGR
jgi:hypothetical protein